MLLAIDKIFLNEIVFDVKRMSNQGIIHSEYSYTEGNMKPTLVFIHGLGGSYSIWIKSISILKKYYNIVLLDLPWSARESIQYYTKKEIIDWFSIVLEKISKKASRVILIPHSFGAIMTIHALSVKPITTDVFFCSPLWDGEKNIMQFTDFVETLSQFQKSSKELIIVNHPSISMNIVDDVVEGLMNQFNMNTVFMFLSCIGNAIKNIDFSNINSAIAYGEKDNLISKSDISDLGGMLGVKEFYIYSNVGHYPMLEEAVLFQKDIIKFVQDDTK